MSRLSISQRQQRRQSRPVAESDLERAITALLADAEAAGVTPSQLLEASGLDTEDVEALAELVEAERAGYRLADVICERLARQIGIDPWDMVGHSTWRPIPGVAA